MKIASQQQKWPCQNKHPSVQTSKPVGSYKKLENEGQRNSVLLPNMLKVFILEGVRNV